MSPLPTMLNSGISVATSRGRAYCLPDSSTARRGVPLRRCAVIAASARCTWLAHRAGETSGPERPEIPMFVAPPVQGKTPGDPPGVDARSEGVDFLGGDSDHVSPAGACAAFHVDAAAGSSGADAAKRLERFGPYRPTGPPRRPGWRRFVDQFRSVLVAILAGTAALAPRWATSTPAQSPNCQLHPARRRSPTSAWASRSTSTAPLSSSAPTVDSAHTRSAERTSHHAVTYDTLNDQSHLRIGR